MGAAAYAAGAGVRRAARLAKGARGLAREAGDRYGVRFALHTHDCPPDQLKTFVRPLRAESARRRGRG